MKIYDLTLTLSPELVVWEDDKPVRIEQVMRLEKGDDFNLSNISLCVHAGTHVDAPLHFLAGGAGVDMLDLECMTGPVYVADCRGEPVIGEAVLSRLNIPAGTRRLLFLTDNSTHDILHAASFRRDFVAVDADGARWLTARGIRLAGIDALSIAPFDAPDPTHQILLKAGVVVVEGLDLTRVEPGMYDLCVMPLKIAGADGAPARVILRQGAAVQ